MDKIAVAVTPEVPFRVELESPRVDLAAGGEIEIKVYVERTEGFREPVRVRLPFLPPWLVSEPHIVVPADADEGVFVPEARPQTASRVWRWSQKQK